MVQQTQAAPLLLHQYTQHTVVHNITHHNNNICNGVDGCVFRIEFANRNRNDVEFQNSWRQNAMSKYTTTYIIYIMLFIFCSKIFKQTSHQIKIKLEYSSSSLIRRFRRTHFYELSRCCSSLYHVASVTVLGTD